MVGIKAFAILDSEGKGYITAEDIVGELKRHYIRTSVEEAEQVIQEFDANEDGTLNLDEFQQLILPSANSNLRRMADLRQFSYSYRADEPLPSDVLKMTASLLEREISFQKKRDNIKRQLLIQSDFTKKKAFDMLSHGEDSISLDNLCRFLEENGFFPKRDDLEAILRRCDHDANQNINFAEFIEISCGRQALS